jgi:predicted DNA-binding protein with PD1-like motif
MQIVPLTAAADLVTQLTTFVTANAVAIVGVMFVGISVTFIMRWFRKSSKVKA